MVGGVDETCGAIFGSYDEGLTWVQELHECVCAGPGCVDCTNDDPLSLYNDDTNRTDDTWRHQSFRTLYGVAIFDGDNSALAGGYNGQRVVRYRDPQQAGEPQGIWKDRSAFSNQPLLNDPLDFASFPFFGAEADAGDAQLGKGLLVGSGGYITRTVNGGESWEILTAGGPYRTRDVWFTDSGIPGLEKGWVVGQLGRIAITTDGGQFWTRQDADESLASPTLLAVTLDSDAQHGVAVGQRDPRMMATYFGKPRILYTLTGGQLPGWLEPASITHFSATSFVGHELRETDWAGGDHWWCAGSGGLIFRSINNGQDWSQFYPRQLYDLDDFQADFEFDSVSFRDTLTGILVGRDPSTGLGLAYQYKGDGAGGVTWTSILPGPPTIDPPLKRVTGVDIAGDVAYAVGWRIDAAGEREGIVLKATASGGQFGDFAIVLQGVPPCKIGEDLQRLGVLEEVEIHPATGDVYAGGECGRLFIMDGSTGTWSEQKSKTDAHVQGLSVTSSGALFLAGHRQDKTQQAITRYDP